MAASRLPRSVRRSKPDNSLSPSGAVSQLPTRLPSCGTPFTRRMPATNSEFNSPRIGSLVGQSADCSEPYVDGGRREQLRLQFHPISEDHATVECEAGLGAIPVDEFIHGMLIRAARLEGCETIEDGSLCLVECGQRGAVRAPGFLAIGTLHERRPPAPPPSMLRLARRRVRWLVGLLAPAITQFA